MDIKPVSFKKVRNKSIRKRTFSDDETNEGDEEYLRSVHIKLYNCIYIYIINTVIYYI